MLLKTQLRQMIKEYRQSLWPELVREKSLTIQTQVLASEEYRHASRIFIYKGVRNETETDLIIAQALSEGKTVALPKIIDGAMEFFSIASLEDLKQGSFGLLEPEADQSFRLEPQTDSMIIVPGVAFDKSLNRCGYGKGFYDSWLVRYPGVFRAGIAFHQQLFDQIETDVFDIPMDRIYTDGEIIG